MQKSPIILASVHALLHEGRGAAMPSFSKVWAHAMHTDGVQACLGGGVTKARLRARLEDRYDAVVGELANIGGKRCWRGMELENGDDPADPRDGVGFIWTTDENVAGEFGSAIYEAVVDTAQIDWVTTIAARLNPEVDNGEHEAELRWKENAPIYVVSVAVNGKEKPIGRRLSTGSY